MQKAPVATAGCRAFTAELRSVDWPDKFKPDLPPRYDGTADPVEFLQLYELGIEAANGDKKVMGNWFPMALKVSVLKCRNLVNIQDHYKVWGSDNNKLNSVGDLASAIINPYYMKMKDESKKDKNV